MLAGRQLISINDSDPFMTTDHLLYTNDGWKVYKIEEEKSARQKAKYENVVGELKLGDKILNVNGGWTEIKSMKAIDNEPEQMVYQFILDGNNTYYADDFLAHGKIEEN
jgi:hypothetical protein